MWKTFGFPMATNRRQKSKISCFPIRIFQYVQLFFIKGQLDFFSGITTCCGLEWILLLFFAPTSDSSHFKAYLLSPSRKEWTTVFPFFSGRLCAKLFLVWGQLSGNQWRLHEQLFLQTVSLFSPPLRLQVFVLSCRRCPAATKLQLLALLTCERDISPHRNSCFCLKMLNLSFKASLATAAIVLRNKDEEERVKLE